MNITYIRFAEGVSSKISCVEHMTAGVHIIAISIGFGQISEDQLYGTDGIMSGFFCGRTADESLNSMGQCVIPVVAVTAGGSPLVTSGSRTAYLGMSTKSLMGYLCRVRLSVMTAANVVSLPVPAVVGMAMSKGGFFIPAKCLPFCPGFFWDGQSAPPQPWHSPWKNLPQSR